jgi:hypothetical protein
MALIGDVDKFVPTGAQRLAVKDNGDSLAVALHLAQGEREVNLALYAPSKPKVEAERSQADVDYDQATGIARIKIHTTGAAQSIDLLFKL